MDHDPSFESDALSASKDNSEYDPMPRSFTDSSGQGIGVVPAAPRCPMYWAGHSIHAIHARHALQSKDWTPARILAVDGNYVEFSTKSDTLRRWHHDPLQLRRAAEIPELLPDAEVLWCDRYYILRVEADRVGLLLSLGKDDVTPCRSR